MANNRIFYASHAVSIANNGTNLRTVQGAQSVSMSTAYNLDSVFQLGRLAIYDNFPANPEVTVTVTKALDGWPLIFSLATQPIAAGQTVTSSIIGGANAITSLIIGVGSDTAPVVDDVNPDYTSISLSGLYVESLSYSFGSEGSFTEEVTFKGNNKLLGGRLDGPVETAPHGGNVLRRQNINLTDSRFPAEVDRSGISNITISTSFNREDIFTMGSYAPRARTVSFPIEITTTFDMHAREISQSVGTTFETANVTAQCVGPSGFNKQWIRVVLCNASGFTEYTFDLGSGNMLQNHGYSGGDTSGGNVTETFEYLTYNELTIEDKVPSSEPENAGRDHASNFKILTPGTTGVQP